MLILGSYVSWSNTSNSYIRDTVAYNYNKYIGVTEEGGNNQGEIVEYFQRQAGLEPDKQAWCSAFVVAVFNESGVEHNMNAWSPTCCPSGDGLVYYKEKYYNGWNYVPKAAVFGLYYSNKNRIGHTGFVDGFYERDNKYVWCVEGNTTIGGSENDGDGVAKRRRNIKTIYKIYDWIGDQEYDTTKVDTQVSGSININTNETPNEKKPIIDFSSIFTIDDTTIKSNSGNTPNKISSWILFLWGTLSIIIIIIKIFIKK